MKEMFEIFESASQSLLDSSKKMVELNLRTFDKIMQQQSELTGIYVDASSKALELMAKAKGYQDLMAGQASLMRECGERCMESVRKSVSLVSESRDEYGALVEENMKLAQAQIAKASSVTLKAAA